MTSIGPGDLVVCVSREHLCLPEPVVGIVGKWLVTGRVYTVAGLASVSCCSNGLILAEDDAPDRDRGFCPCRFRKLNDGEEDAELIARIKSCQPMKAREDA